MKYVQASKLQRFLTFFIDFISISILVSLCSSAIYAITGYDSSILEELSTRLTNELYNYLSGAENYETLQSIFMQYFRYSLLDSLIDGGLYLFFVVIIFVVIPMFWKCQTIGRCLMKTKAVDKSGSEMTKKQILLWELVGTYLIYVLFGGIVAIISAAFVLSAKGKSLVDQLSGTDLKSIKESDLVVERELSSEDEKAEVFMQDDEDEYIDAKFKEVKKTRDNDKFDIDDDDYKVI